MRNFEKCQKIEMKKSKIKILIRQFDKIICESPKNVNKILVPSSMLSSTQKNVSQSFFEADLFRTGINDFLVENQ